MFARTKAAKGCQLSNSGLKPIANNDIFLKQISLLFFIAIVWQWEWGGAGVCTFIWTFGHHDIMRWNNQEMGAQHA